MKRPLLLIALCALAPAGCGGSDETASAPAPADAAEVAATATAGDESGAVAEPARKRRRGTKIRLRGSEFGRMLFGPGRQAIYGFERDGRKRTRCFGSCAKAWPPVLTRGRPRAGKGVDRGRLGTIRRPNGRRQVTYHGRPLYYYAHEGAGEVRCHNVFLNGGLWWVIGADGEPRP